MEKDVLAEVERRLDVTIAPLDARTGAWAETAGYLTTRDTWVRIDSRPSGFIQPQSWIGPEAASVIRDVPKPAWLQSATWTDAHRGLVWRVDEMEYVADPVVATSGTMLTSDPGLPDTWWKDLHEALGALARHRTLRVSGRQELITRRIAQVVGGMVDTTVTEWTTSHGDLHWGNVTAPTLYLLDWADWGMAPRGNDAACLWGSALACAEIADRVLHEFRADLESRSGLIARLWVVCNILRMSERREDARALAAPAREASERLIEALT